MSGLKQCAVPIPPNPNIWEFCFEISSSLHPMVIEEIKHQPECFSELIFESYPHPLYIRSIPLLSKSPKCLDDDLETLGLVN